ncbi:TetR/AcrR family transcriptional regulator C-terminal ligand-binding domain-containing protein [Streptomyces sp. NBC_01224]|uniref:TetR-like C-terminal domain-containing protein n=1 Tax=Streptomyces sp. NBC_01224 TaxID=2903783 RepID=UPI002E1148DE|nr:TetR/AcrR family transcriptional regulator C-terminal ligand-binding domain-containing protein [Streptomyces sp. NBC_01224]
MEVGGDVRDQTGQHELGCALGEDGESERVDSKWHEETPWTADGWTRQGVWAAPARHDERQHGRTSGVFKDGTRQLGRRRSRRICARVQHERIRESAAHTAVVLRRQPGGEPTTGTRPYGINSTADQPPVDRWLVSVGLGAGHDREATSSDLLAATSFAAGTAEHRQVSGILCTLMAEARIGAGFGERLRTGFLERRRDVLRTVLDRAAHRGDLPARPAPSTVLDRVRHALIPRPGHPPCPRRRPRRRAAAVLAPDPDPAASGGREGQP